MPEVDAPNLETVRTSREDLLAGGSAVSPSVSRAVHSPLQTGWMAAVRSHSIKRSDLWVDANRLVAHGHAPETTSVQPVTVCTGRATALAFLARSLVVSGTTPTQSRVSADTLRFGMSELVEMILAGESPLTEGVGAGMLVTTNRAGEAQEQLVVVSMGPTVAWASTPHPRRLLQLKVHHLAGLWASLEEWLSPLGDNP